MKKAPIWILFYELEVTIQLRLQFGAFVIVIEVLYTLI